MTLLPWPSQVQAGDEPDPENPEYGGTHTLRLSAGRKAVFRSFSLHFIDRTLDLEFETVEMFKEVLRVHAHTAPFFRPLPSSGGVDRLGSCSLVYLRSSVVIKRPRAARIHARAACCSICSSLSRRLSGFRCSKASSSSCFTTKWPWPKKSSPSTTQSRTTRTRWRGCLLRTRSAASTSITCKKRFPDAAVQQETEASFHWGVLRGTGSSCSRWF